MGPQSSVGFMLPLLRLGRMSGAGTTERGWECGSLGRGRVSGEEPESAEGSGWENSQAICAKVLTLCPLEHGDLFMQSINIS